MQYILISLKESHVNTEGTYKLQADKVLGGKGTKFARAAWPGWENISSVFSGNQQILSQCIFEHHSLQCSLFALRFYVSTYHIKLLIVGIFPWVRLSINIF